MRKKLQWGEISFRVNTKADIILIKQHTNEENYQKVPPKSAIAASSVTKDLVKCGVRLPAQYIMHWDDDIKMWVGNLNKPSFKGASEKKLKPSGTIKLNDLV